MVKTHQFPPVSESLQSSFFDYVVPPNPAFPSRSLPMSREGGQMRVVDDWPDYVLLAKAELDLLEFYLSDVVDTILGPPPT